MILRVLVSNNDIFRSYDAYYYADTWAIVKKYYAL
jgi:hypothetical protein